MCIRDRVTPCSAATVEVTSLADAWLGMFDLVVVDACKPRFWAAGTQQVRLAGESNTTTPAYSGGRAEQVQQLLGAAGRDILYVGDHLLADVIKCRKQTEVS